MKIRLLDSDGSNNDQNEFDLPILGEDGEALDPPVTIRCQALLPEMKSQLVRKSHVYEKNEITRGTARVKSDQKLEDLCIQHVILSWEGIYGGDGKPLVCNDKTKVYLPQYVKVQVFAAAVNTEEVDASAESFRQPADVVRVVGGRRAK